MTVSAVPPPNSKTPVHQKTAAGPGQLVTTTQTRNDACDKSVVEENGSKSQQQNDNANMTTTKDSATTESSRNVIDPNQDDDDDDDDTPLSAVSLVRAFGSGNSRFNEGVAMAKDKGNQLILAAVVKNDIFPQLKIINDDAELNDTSDNSLANVIMDKVNVPQDDGCRSGFWSTVKYAVNKQLGNLRQQVNSKLRTAYFSK